ncbi:MAG: tyrosine-type recombinase/integrase [Egibacteraceae bacterium]
MARGSIRERAGSFEVNVYAGRDPLTGKERRRTGTRKTRREAEALLAKLLTEVAEGRVSNSKATLAELLERWLETADHEFTTRTGYERYIATKILPALGDVQVRKIRTETLDQFYVELRKRGGANGGPLAGSTVRKIHFILRAALGQAVKWEWIPSNPAERATIPKHIRQELVLPSPDEVARFMQAAWDRDPDFAALLWVAMVTGARRGELCGLRWSHLRLDEGRLQISRNIVQRGGQRREKDTKTHQSRLLEVDELTAEILAEHAARCEARAAACNVLVRPDGFVFSTSPDGAEPIVPDSVTQRINRLARRLEVPVTLRALRHYAATQMLTRGVDLRTAAGRLGHGDGGTTTLRVYTHFLRGPDRRAAELLAGSIPRPRTELPSDNIHDEGGRSR